MAIFGSEDWFAEGKTVEGNVEEDVAKAEYLGFTPHIYKDYYPDGYSACVADQKCRGNEDAHGACGKLLNGDPSDIITVAKYAGGSLSSVMSGCPAVFKRTRLGSKMAAMSLDKSVAATVVDAVNENGYNYNVDPYKDTGGVGTTDTSPLITRPELNVPDWKNPFAGAGNVFGSVKRSLQAVGIVLILFVLAIIYLIFVKGKGASGVTMGKVG